MAPDGTVYVPSEQSFFAINPNGTLKWKKWGTGFFDNAETLSAPAVAADGKIYVANANFFDEGLYALNPANGDTLWSFPIGRTTYGSPTVGDDGTIYIGSAVGASENQRLYAVNPDGTLKWRWDSNSPCWIESSPAIGPSGDIYVNHNCLGLVALDQNGNRKWNQPDPGDVWNSPSVGPGGTIYIGDSPGFFAVNPDGTIQWEVPTDNFMYSASSAISTDGSTIYRGDNGGKFYAFDSSGFVRWKYDSGECCIFSAPALAGNNIVYFVNGPHVYALRASDGAFLWRYEIGGSSSSPAIAADGTLYVLGNDVSGNGVLHAFRCSDGICDVTPPASPPADFDGDGDTDVSVWRPANGFWYVLGGVTQQWGAPTDVPVPGDYDGDGDTDIAVWRPSNGFWYVNGGLTQQWGAPTDVPVPGDYDGDGDTDIAVWRPSNGIWYVRGGVTQQRGAPTDIPVPGDFDGDGDTDIAVWRPSNGIWYVLGGVTQQWGAPTDIPVPGDFDGDGDTNIAVWRPSNGIWYVLGGVTQQWGAPTDVPVPGDYDGDGDTDVGVWRPSNGIWHVHGGITQQWGAPTDVPVVAPPWYHVLY